MQTGTGCYEGSIHLNPLSMSHLQLTVLVTLLVRSKGDVSSNTAMETLLWCLLHFS